MFKRALATVATAFLMAGGAASAETVYLTAGHFVDPVSGETVRDAAFVIEDGAVALRGT